MVLRIAGCGPVLRAGFLHRPVSATTTAAVPLPRLFSSSINRPSTVKLGYDLHEAEKPVSNDPNHESPILFMHGLFGSKRNNRAISKALARDLGRSIYALDLRNHGESPHAPRHDYSAMAEDVDAFIKEHSIDQPTLVGHSMGAKTAMVLALQSPRMIKDIVSVDNAPVDATLSTDFAKYVRAMKKIEDAGVSSQRKADELLAEVEESLPIRQFLLSNLHTKDGLKKFRVPIDILGKALSHMGDFPHKEPGKVRFERPALFVRGTKSKYVPDEVLPVVGEFFPLFEVADIDAGHWVISESPEAFRDAVVRFLSPKE
ncbi:Alpha/Beta hydrolase protein [Coniella lustricola]|uniref:Alpha/Beta hydrolase protein n=1 Tax=Coniella lustricola TaxID=2025994 RepID=A0A2T3AL36_9PEZI|nr:Alpha/Beta hydrolase protein [Coniella lustricola]